jgi:chromosomal replication initiation ATPase DnaA
MWVCQRKRRELLPGFGPKYAGFFRTLLDSNEGLVPTWTETATMIDRILEVVAEKFGVSVADIKSSRRSRQVLPARHVAAYLAHTALGMTPPDIGEQMGGRDYTNILMYCRAIERRAAEDDALREMLMELKAALTR